VPVERRRRSKSDSMEFDELFMDIWCDVEEASGRKNECFGDELVEILESLWVTSNDDGEVKATRWNSKKFSWMFCVMNERRMAKNWGNLVKN
jgi:hypothetical protein